MFMTAWSKSFYKDLTTTKFIPLKVIAVLNLGGATSLFPFMTIHARSLGISEQELGILYSILPVLGIFLPTLTGMIADKIGNFKVFLSVMILISGFSSLGLLLVPPGRLQHDMPVDLPLFLNCSADGTHVNILPPFDCIHHPETKSIPISAQNCTKRCLYQNTGLIPEECLQRPGNCIGIHQISDDGQSQGMIDVIENQLEMKMLIDHQNGYKKYVENLTCSGDIQHLTEVSTNDCWIECESSINRKELCSNDQSVEDIDPAKTVILYSIALFVMRIFSAAGGPLIGGATIAILKEHGGDFGFQSIYMNFGMIIFTPISGKLIDIFSSGSNQVNFGPPVYIYLGMSIICSIFVLFIDLEFKKPAENVFKNLTKLLMQFEILALLFVNFIVGCCFGFLETFLFWLLEDLGADKEIMGITITVGAAAGIPILLFSTPIIKKLGHANTLTFSLFVFVFRFIGYTFINSPWMAMPFEFLECFTLALFGVASTSYVSELTTPYTVVTLQSVVSAIHWGVGKGAGSLIGGLLSKSYGLNVGFRIMAVICGVSSVLYFVSNWFFFRKTAEERSLSKDRESNEKKDKLGA